MRQLGFHVVIAFFRRRLLHCASAVMDDRKQTLKRAESRTSTHSRANSVKWKDRFLSPTFHDVQIEQVRQLFQLILRHRFLNPYNTYHPTGASQLTGINNTRILAKSTHTVVRTA